MRLNNDYVLYDMGDEKTLIPTGSVKEQYNGIVQCNSTAAFIIKCLENDTTEEEILKRLKEKYEGDHEHMAASVTKVLDNLRTIHALVE